MLSIGTAAEIIAPAAIAPSKVGNPAIGTKRILKNTARGWKMSLPMTIAEIRETFPLECTPMSVPPIKNSASAVQEAVSRSTVRVMKTGRAIG